MKIDIDGARIWSDLMTMGAIGATRNGGSYRPTLTDADREARNLFVHWAGEAGYGVQVDRIGNIFVRRAGAQPALPPVLVGSHLDTQMPGGKFDGVLGVLAGLEVLRSLDRCGVTTQRSIEIVNWTNEEGARFPGLMGSSVFAGQLALDTALSFADRDGLTVAQELSRIGYAGDLPVGGRSIDSYLELHIEQGPRLEAGGTTIGVVTNSSWWGGGAIEFHGANGHSQTEPMSKRRNALIGAARIILDIEAIGAAAEPDGMVSVTVIENLPNNRINLPHWARINFALVHATAAGRDDMLAQISAAARQIANNTGLEVVDGIAAGRGRLDFSEEIMRLVEHEASTLGLSHARMPTLTGHDALNMNFICPTGIIFVPCRDGISHSEAEWCEPDHATAGAGVLLNATIARANRL